MNIYNELKIIAEDNRKRCRLAEELSEKVDLEGYDLCRANVLSGCCEEDGKLYDRNGIRLDNCGLIDDEYYLFQRTGYLEDDYYGTVFYATKTPGEFVAVPFAV